MSLARETLLGATTQGASHYYSQSRSSNTGTTEIWLPALLVAGLHKPFDETTQAGFDLGATTCQGLLYCLPPEWFISAVFCCLCRTCLLVPLCEECDSPDEGSCFWMGCLCPELCWVQRRHRVTCSGAGRLSATCTSPWITLRSHWSWGSHLVFCICWTWMRSASSCWVCDTLKTLTLHLEIGIKQVCMQGGLLLCCAPLLSLPAGVCAPVCSESGVSPHWWSNSEIQNVPVLVRQSCWLHGVYRAFVNIF